jgi:anti-sigma factor RsiW
MDCTVVAGTLVAYHLGAATDDEADAVEAHLVACASCLRTYLAIKRAADRAQLERPRPEVKERLRAEVARSFPAPARVRDHRARPLPMLVRRIPLYQGVALAALAASIALVAPGVVRRVARSEAAPGVPVIDTARTRAESLHIY